MPEAIAVYLPRPSTAMLKIAPHITEVQRPTSNMAKMPTGTSCVMKVIADQSTPGKGTSTSVGAKDSEAAATVAAEIIKDAINGTFQGKTH